MVKQRRVKTGWKPMLQSLVIYPFIDIRQRQALRLAALFISAHTICTHTVEDATRIHSTNWFFRTLKW